MLTLVKVDIQQPLVWQRELRMGDLISFPKAFPKIGQRLPGEEPMPTLRRRPVVGSHHTIDQRIASSPERRQTVEEADKLRLAPKED